MKKSELLILEEIWVDDLEDQILLAKKIDCLLQKIKVRRERLVILLCDEERSIFKGAEQ